MSAPAPLPRPLAASEREALLRQLWQSATDAAAATWGVPVDDVRTLTQRRLRHASLARRAALAALRWLCPWASLPAIGRVAGYAKPTNIRAALELLDGEIRCRGGGLILSRVAHVVSETHKKRNQS